MESGVDDRTKPLPAGAAAVGRSAAFFDLDKTIIATSSTLAFSRPFFANGLITRRSVIRSMYAQFVFLPRRRRPRPDRADAALPVRLTQRLGGRRQSSRSSPTRSTTSSIPLVYDEAARR